MKITLKDWYPTHLVHLGKSRRKVMVTEVPGPAYTRTEWVNCTGADIEVQEDGSWTFQGGPFPGKMVVRKLI
jgi:hypothetical protein